MGTFIVYIIFMSIIITLLVKILTHFSKPTDKHLKSYKKTIPPEKQPEENAEQPVEQPKPIVQPQELGKHYRKKYLLTPTEYRFYMELREICNSNHLIICPKVRMEDFIAVIDQENLQTYRNHIKSRHIDFLVCDNNLNILAGIELDDYTHNFYKAKKGDTIKNDSFKEIGLPLFRVKVAKSYEQELNNIITQLTQKSI